MLPDGCPVAVQCASRLQLRCSTSVHIHRCDCDGTYYFLLAAISRPDNVVNRFGVEDVVTPTRTLVVSCREVFLDGTQAALQMGFYRSSECIAECIALKANPKAAVECALRLVAPTWR